MSDLEDFSQMALNNCFVKHIHLRVGVTKAHWTLSQGGFQLFRGRKRDLFQATDLRSEILSERHEADGNRK